MRKGRILGACGIVALLASSMACSQQKESQDNTSNEDQSNKIEVVVHRGANKLAPENTIESAFAALDNGADWIELDVRMSKDSIFYNLHDDTLDRTTNGSGSIGEWYAADIDTLDAGAWFSDEYKGCKVPTIEVMLDTLSTKARFFFDVKRGTPIPRFVALLEKKGINQDNSFFWFADTLILKEFVAMAPTMPIKVNAKTVEDIERWKQRCDPKFIECSLDAITPELKECCSNNGIKIMAAIQEGNEEDYNRAIELRPDMVNLDMPELFKKCLEESQGSNKSQDSTKANEK